MFQKNMTPMTMKCRKCRNLLLVYPEVDVLTAHGESCGNVGVEYVNCETIQEDNVWFLGEAGIPEWISSRVNESNWTKGKVNCPQCNGRLGSFDFISGTKCQCGSHTLPPIHIVKCKVGNWFPCHRYDGMVEVNDCWLQGSILRHISTDIMPF